MNGPWTIREAAPAERETLARAEHDLFPSADAPRAEWLLDANPSGEASVMVAVDPQGRIGATRSIFPWRVAADGTEAVLAQIGRSWTHPEARLQGLSVRLGRALQRRTGERGFPIMFSFPSDRSYRGHVKLDHLIEPGMRRRQALPGPGALVPAIPRFVDAPLGALRRLAVGTAFRRWARWEVSADPAGDADRLWPRLAARTGVYGVRDGAVVGWRYSADSGRPYRVRRFPAGGPARLLAGTLTRGVRARIVEVWGEAEPGELRAALAALVETLAAEGARVVDWCPPVRGPQSRIGIGAGFLPRRPGTPFARWFTVPREGLGALDRVENYRLTEGDTDYV